MNWLWLCMMSLANADVLQTPPLEEKESAQKILSISQRMLRKEKGVTVKQGRFLVPQKGYRYRVVVEGVSGDANALTLAKRLHGIWDAVELITDAGQSKIYDVEKDVFELVVPEEKLQSVEQEPTATMEQNTTTEEEVAQKYELEDKPATGMKITISDVLQQAKTAMEALENRWEGISSEKFFFERELLHNGKKVRVHHRFFQKGDAMRLEISIKEGEGEDSTTILTPNGKGVLAVQDKKQERSAARTQEILKTFTSRSQLSILLNFPKDVQSNGPWRNLDGLEKLEQAWRLYLTDEEQTGVIRQAIFSEKEGWLLQLVVRDEDGLLEYRWTDYTEIGGDVFVPFRITRIRNGFVQETIVIESLYLDTSIEETLFSIE